MKKQFLWEDRSGRGFKNTWSLTDLKKAMARQKSYGGISASVWAKDAEVGHEWMNEANRIVRIK